MTKLNCYEHLTLLEVLALVLTRMRESGYTPRCVTLGNGEDVCLQFHAPASLDTEGK